MTVQTLGLWASKPPESYTLPATSIHGGSHGLAHCQGAWILALTAHAHSQWHSIPDDPPAIHRNSPSLQISLGPWLADENVEPPCGDTKRPTSPQDFGKHLHSLACSLGCRQMELLVNSQLPCSLTSPDLCSWCSLALIPVQPAPSLPVAFLVHSSKCSPATLHFHFT